MGRRLRRWGLRVVAVVLVLLVTGELVSRYYLGLGDPPLSVFDEKVEYRFKPGVYHRFGNTISINLFSMRSAPIAPQKSDLREVRVLVVGDSVVNGGSLTDDRELATTLLQRRLADALGRPVLVANISAGSWGPPNQAAYLRKFGWFDADALVLVLSSHDGADTPSFEPTVGIHPGFPDRAPPFALAELVARYSPLSGVLNRGPIQSFEVQYPSRSGELLEVRKKRCGDALAEMLTEAAARKLPHFILMHSTRAELNGSIVSEREVITQVAQQHAVPIIENQTALRDAIASGSDPFRDNDDIHPNALGQQILSDLLFAQLMPALTDKLGVQNSETRK